MATKQPYEAFTFTYDFAADLGSDTIASVDVVDASGPDSALVKQAQSNTPTAVLVRWGAGTDGASYYTTVRITTASGDTFERDGVISVAEAGEAASSSSLAYGTDDGFAQWLSANGYNLPGSSPAPSVLRARGTTYVDGYELYWTGQRTGGVMQELAWPRTRATINCVTAIPVDVIPPSVVNAAYRAAWLEAETPGVLTGSSAALGSRVKRERVEGAVEVEYFDDGKPIAGGGLTFIDSLIDSALRAFVCDPKGGAFLWTLGC